MSVRTRSRLRHLTALVAAIVAFAAFNAPVHAAHDGRTLDVTPETGTSVAGLQATLTATVSSAADLASGPIEIDFEIEGGPNDISGPTNEAGYTPLAPDLTCTILVGQTSCTASYAPATNNLDQIRAWIHHTGADRSTEPDASEQVNENILPGAVAEPDRTDVVSNLVTNGVSANVLDCRDEAPAETGGDDVATNPTTGDQAVTNETYTCRVTLSGAGVPNAVVDAEIISGPNDPDAGKAGEPDFTCTTTTSGSCTIDVPNQAGTLAAGTAIVCFWIDSNNDSVVDDQSPANGSDCGEPVDEAENTDVTDTTRVSWATRIVTTIDIVDEDESRVLPGQPTMPVALKALDQFGGGIAGAEIDLYVIGGPNADSGTTVTKGCTTTADGTCTVTYTSGGSNGIDRLCAWLDADPADLYQPGGPEGDGGLCGTEPEAPGTDGPPALTDRGQVTWSGGAPVATQLEVTPEIAPGGNVAEGTHYSLTANVKDENGNAMAGQVVNFEVIGPGDPDASPGDSPASPDRVCTTGANGSCSLDGEPGPVGTGTTISSSTVGLAAVRAWVAGIPADLTEGYDAGSPPDEPAGTPDTPGGRVEPDTTDVVSIKWGKLRTAFGSFVVSPRDGVYGIDPRFSGTLVEEGTTNPVGGAEIGIFRRFVGSSFVRIGIVTTASDGTFAFQDFNPPHNADYQALFGGDADRLSVGSSFLRVGIRPGVIFNASPTHPQRNRPTTISGAVIPSKAGKKVSLQWLDGRAGQWRNVKTVTLDRNSRFSFTYTRNGPGYLLFRIIYVTQDSQNLWNVSRNIKVTWT